MTIFYWSVANLLYITGADLTNADFYQTSKVVSILLIITYIIYTIVRWVFNPLGGLYMAKRIVLATILAGSYLNYSMLAPLVIMETVFVLLRFVMEAPEKSSEKMFLIGEWLVHVAVYILLFLVTNAGVNTIIISTVIFVMIVVLAHDLTEVYLESQNEWLFEEEEQKQLDEDMIKASPKQRLSLYQKDQ